MQTARLLLGEQAARQAEVLGVALRLAYTLSAGTPDSLVGTALEQTDGVLTLRLSEGDGVFAGESVLRRLDRLAGALGVATAIEIVAGTAKGKAALI